MQQQPSLPSLTRFITGKELLALQGFPVDLLPTTLPPGQGRDVELDLLFADLAGNMFSASVELSLKIAALALVKLPQSSGQSATPASQSENLASR